MVVCNICSLKLECAPPGLHRGFIYGQVDKQQPEPFLKLSQTKLGPLLRAKQTLWNTDTGFRLFYLITLFIHFDNILYQKY